MIDSYSYQNLAIATLNKSPCVIAFPDNEIDGVAFCDLTEDDIKAIIKPIGFGSPDFKKVLAAIQLYLFLA